MKSSLQCPKCRCRKIWCIEEPHHDNRFQGGTPLRVVYERRVGPVNNGFFSDGGRDRVSVGTYEVFICTACGYAEWYARDIEALEENPDEGVRLLDGELQGSAYR